MLLAGTEELSFELGGTVPASAARAFVPRGLELLESAGVAEIALTVFRMKGLRIRRLPGPGLDYSEALWRLAVLREGLPAWLALACDLDSGLVRALGHALIRYPVRPARLVLAPRSFTLSVDGAELSVALGEQSGLELRSPASRPLLVAARGKLWRVPWGEIPPREAESRVVEIVSDGLSPLSVARVDWAPDATLLTGRGHRCGVAAELAAGAPWLPNVPPPA